MRLICCSIVFILCPHLFYDPHFRLFDGKSTIVQTQVSTLVSVAFFLSMVAQPFFGYINERFGIVKMTTLSLSVIIGGVFGFLWAPNLFWLTVFMGLF